jgi:hypothetical protein
LHGANPAFDACHRCFLQLSIGEDYFDFHIGPKRLAICAMSAGRQT